MENILSYEKWNVSIGGKLYTLKSVVISEKYIKFYILRTNYEKIENLFVLICKSLYFAWMNPWKLSSLNWGIRINKIHWKYEKIVYEWSER